MREGHKVGVARGAELIDLLPELRPAPDGVGQCAQAEHDLGALVLPAHPGGAQALLDQGLAGGLGDARADRQALGEEARVVHLMAMVVEVGPSAVGLIAHCLRERGAARERRRIRDELVDHAALVLESAALLVLPGGTLVLAVAFRPVRLRELADVLGGVEEVDQLAIGVLIEEGPVARSAVGDAEVAGLGVVLLGAGDLARQALVERLFAVLGRGGQVDGVPALAAWS
jgi:hypothetical protein